MKIKRFPREHRPRRFPRLHRGSSIVVNIRGTNGSGKTTVIFRLIKELGGVPLFDDYTKTWAYHLKKAKHSLYILGKYDTPTGGCDTIRSMELIQDGVRRLSAKGNVIFEGLLVSGMHTRWVDLAHSLPKAKFIFGVLDTPVEKCIEQTTNRRKKQAELAGKVAKVFNPQNLIAKHRAVLSSTKALKAAGMDVRTLNHKKAYETVLKWFNEGD